MNEVISNEIIEKCYYLCESLKENEPNFYGKLYQKIYDTKSNYVHYFPRLLVLQLTSACNLRCRHCFFAEKQEKYSNKNDLSEQELFRQLKYFVEEVNILHCTITGGEIFTSPFLFDVIRYLKKNNITLKLITNGTLIKVDEAKELGELLNPKFDIIQVSLDGAVKETNDIIRGDGCFEKTVNVLKYLINNNCNTEIGFTINSQNVNEISDLYILAKNLGVKKINYGRFTQQYESQNSLNPKIEDIFTNVAKLADIYDKCVDLRLQCITIPDYLEFKTGQMLLDKKLEEEDCTVLNLKCRPHDEQVTMFSDGSISLCYDCTINDVIIGNIRRKPFEEIWKNRHNNQIFYVRDINNHACRKCKYISLCKSGCPYRAIVKYGNVNEPGLDCKYYQQIKGQE